MKHILNLIIIFICCLVACKEKPQEVVIAPTLPNIIYILADDLGYGDLSCYGQTNFKTPNIDKLAAEGMLFTQHYSGSTVCAPSRSALMTGLHTGHTFIRGNKEVKPEGQYPLADTIFTLPELLKQQGYVTGAFGKWGLGYPGSEGDPLNQGFDTFFGYNCQRLAHHYYPYYLWDNNQKYMLTANEGKQESVYAPEVIHERVLTFLEANKDTSFFLFVPSPVPHAELKVPEKYASPFEGRFEPDTPYKGVDDGDKYRDGPYGSQDKPHKVFAAMVQLLDQQVGEIMEKVEALGIAENTLIIFTSDNGPHLEGGADPDFFNSNGPLKGYKRDLYEGGIRVPMIAKWTGKIKSGSKTDHISAFWDVKATISELIGKSLVSETDGISFVPTLLQQGEQRNHEYLYWEFHEKGGRVAVRKGNWKAVRYNVNKGSDAPLQLYNLQEDIGEENNVASEFPEIIAEMEELLKTARTPSPVFKFVSETYLEIP
ncbi:MAG: arylsulfatase [Bacteroidota bacterium]